MAITLSVDLNDAEQAKVIEWLDQLLPNLTGAQKKVALEQHAKGLLRDDLIARIRNVRRQALLDAQAAGNASDVGVVDANDPFDPTP